MKAGLDNKKIVELAEEILLKYKLCDHCLGRNFAKIEPGKTNKKRGEILRKNIKINFKTKANDCWLCLGLIGEILHFTDLIENSLKKYEFETFLIGTKIDEDILQREQELLDYTNYEYSESIKVELNREIGKILEEKLKKEVDFEKPTIMVIVDTSFDEINLQISSIFIYGRYRKFRRNLPQTRWFCSICNGKGCRKCNYTGKLYESSVEELVANPFLDETKGDNESFHGCGREDIDVRMLGNGRPFVLEIQNPIIRNINLQKLEKKINNSNKDKIEVCNLRFSDRNEIVRIKSAQFKKTYLITFKSKKPINKEKLKKVAHSLRGKTIKQFTPLRVAHRRANATREKNIYDCNIESVEDTLAILLVEAESGTYIKELISGDDGRTRPSISEMIGIPCEVTELDVIEIKGE